MLELLREALKAGHRAKYVLFDSWFSNPKQILDVHALQMDVIAMVKRSPTIRYCFQGKQMRLKACKTTCSCARRVSRAVV